MAVMSVLLFLIFGSLNCGNERVMLSTDQEDILRYQLSAAETFKPEQPVHITFTLENVSPDTLYVLTWYTPLEGLKGNIFKVLFDSTELRYRGPMIKRGSPDRDDYLRLNPGEKKENRIDLSRGYDLSIPGFYSVAFNRRFGDVVKSAAKLPRKPAEFTPLQTMGNTIHFEITAR